MLEHSKTGTILRIRDQQFREQKLLKDSSREKVVAPSPLRLRAIKLACGTYPGILEHYQQQRLRESCSPSLPGLVEVHFVLSKGDVGLEARLSGRVPAFHGKGPAFHVQHQNNDNKK